MRPLIVGFTCGMLAASALGVALPNLHPLRWALASVLLSSAIVTAAWYLP